MTKANFLSLNLRDLLKGAIVAVLTAVFATLTALLETGKLFEKASLPLIGAAALTAFLGYLTKNLFTNSQGEILTTEKKVIPSSASPVTKILIFAIILSGIGITANAQSSFDGFFKPSKAISFEAKHSLGAETVVSGKWLFRPQVAITAVNINLKTKETSTFSSAGLGIGYNHFSNLQGEAFNDYGVNLLLLLGKEIPSEVEIPKAAFFIAAVFNALGWINIGPIYDTSNNTLGLLTGVSLKF